MPENIEQAILAIYKEVGYVQKQSKPGLNFSYAGEAALIAAIRPAMVENDVTVRVSRVLSRDRIEYQTKSGATMFTSSVTLELRFTHAPSGTWVTVETAGDGGDVGDKSMSKAITSAFKYGLRNTFMIETGDDPDGHASEEKAAKGTRQNGQRNQRPDVDTSTGEVRAKPNLDEIPAKEDPAATDWWSAFAKEMGNLGLHREDVAAVIGADTPTFTTVTNYLKTERTTVAKLLSRAVDQRAAKQEAVPA